MANHPGPSGQLQQHQQQQQRGALEASRIREVWAENMEEEFAYIRAAIDQEPGYRFVAMVRPSAVSPLASRAQANKLVPAF